MGRPLFQCEKVTVRSSLRFFEKLSFKRKHLPILEDSFNSGSPLSSGYSANRTAMIINYSSNTELQIRARMNRHLWNSRFPTTNAFCSAKRSEWSRMNMFSFAATDELTVKKKGKLI